MATHQCIPIGTATGGSDHRTNTGQLQHTTMLRTSRADPDPPCTDGLLCRTVGVAIRARTTHRHAISRPIPRRRFSYIWLGIDGVWRFSRSRVGPLHGPAVSPALRLRTTALVAVLAETGRSSTAVAHGDHRHHRHSRKKKKAYNKGYRQGYRRAIENFYRT